jgi:hypothetical protein
MLAPFPELEPYESTRLQPNYGYFSGLGKEYAAVLNI